MNIIYRIMTKIPIERIKIKWLLKLYKKEGMVIGRDTNFFSNKRISEPFLVSIGSHCTISNDVCFLTHDSAIGALTDRNIKSDLLGKITIGDNCFIGYGAIILLGVSIPNNTVVAAGAVVTKSFDCEKTIIGGNPAKVIGTVENYIEKNSNNFFSLHNSKNERKKIITLSPEKYVLK